MNVTSGVNAQTPLLPPSERGNDEKPVAEIVEFNAYGNKPRCFNVSGNLGIVYKCFQWGMLRGCRQCQ